MAYWTSALAALTLLSHLSAARTARDLGKPAGALPDMAPTAAVPEGVRIKPGVILRGLDERMYPAIRTADAIWLRHGHALMITSGLDGKHAKNSRHYAGRALDFRTRNLDRTTRRALVRELRETLGGEFRVFSEKDHIHVDYDPSPKRGTAWARSSGVAR